MGRKGEGGHTGPLSDDKLPTPVEMPAQAPYALAVEPDCPKCTGPMVKCQVGHVAIYGWWLERVVRQAGVLGPPHTVSTDVTASTCIRCGYTELYAKEPAALALGDDAN